MAWRRALARRLWRRRRVGHGRGRDLGIADGRAVSRHRRKAHAARRADRRRGDRRQLCHRRPARRDLVGRHAVARRRVSIVGGLGALARPRQPVVAAGRGGDGERAGAGSRARIRRGRAGRRDPLWRAALWRAGARRRQHVAQHGPAGEAHRPVSCEIAGSGIAAQRMAAPTARSLADVAEPDAAPLSAAAVFSAVAHVLWRRLQRGAARAGVHYGGRTIGGRSRLAGNFRRGCARPDRLRAGYALTHVARQGGGRRRRRWDRLRADGGRPRNH